MMPIIRILIALLGLAEGTAWTLVTAGVWQWGNSFKGAGDGAGEGVSTLDQSLSLLLIGAIWLLPVSPYICMALGSLNLITGTWMRVAYVYSLVVLSIMMVIVLLTF